MFFRKDNYVAIDFLEENKPTRNGDIKEFSTEGIVIKFDDEDYISFVPFTAISEVKLIKGTLSSMPRTQF